MQLLKDRIIQDGRILPGNIIKVDSFLNHRIDPKLMDAIADEFAKYFDLSKVTTILTAEASGIALAAICAHKYGLPMIFAKKAKSDNIEGGLFTSDIYSYTYNKKMTLLVSSNGSIPQTRYSSSTISWQNGEALGGLCRIVGQAGAELVGIGVAIEKASRAAEISCARPG